jgi:hypothetical protein
MLDPESYSIERLPPKHGSHGGSPPPEEKKSCPRITSAAELQSKTFKPIPYIVPDYIVEGCTILAGKPKLGKSWLMLDIGLAVARGGCCLGDIECEEGDVLYLALEDNERRLQARITKILGATLREWPARFQYATDWARADAGGADYIREWIQTAEKPRLIVVDVLAMFRPPRARDATLYDDDYSAVKKLQRIACETGVAIVIVHHLRKSAAENDPFEKVSGTLGLSGAADSVLVLDRDSSGTTLYGRGRDIEEVETAVEFDRRTCRWRILGAAADVHRSDERSCVLKALKEAGEWMSPTDIADATRMSTQNVRQLLVSMVKAGDVTRRQRGQYVHPDHNRTPDHNDHEITNGEDAQTQAEPM